MKPELFHLDDFDKCLLQNNASIFCMLSAQLYPKNVTNPSKTWKILEKRSSGDGKYRHDLLRHGICVPNECWSYHETISECLERIYDQKYESVGLGAQIINEQCETKKSEFVMSTVDKLFLAILASYIICVLLVAIWLKTGHHKTKNNNKETTQSRTFLSSFCIFDNFVFLIDRNVISNDTYMNYIQGLRFITSILVIAFHVVGSLTFVPPSNPTFVEELMKSFLAMFFSNGGMWVQTFFVISSWFLSIKFFKKLQKSKTVEFGYIVRCIFKRYIRLTPPYLLIIALHSTWLVSLNHGPFWKLFMAEEYKMCRKYYWENLLYFNNFFYDTRRTCLLHSWYLSVEFQFNLLGLFMLWLVQNRPRNIFRVAGFVVAFQILVMFYVLASNHFEIATTGTPENMLFMENPNVQEFAASWTSTYSNLAGLMSGLCFGYLYSYYNGQCFSKKIHTYMWWIVSWTFILFPLLFSPYYMTTEYYSKSRWFAATYGSIHQILFVFGVGLLIFGMSQGLGGGVKKVLGLPVMHTLGQLSFGAYLIHYTFLKHDIVSRRSVEYMSHLTLIFDVTSNLAISYLFSVIFTTFLIMPVENISQLIL